MAFLSRRGRLRLFVAAIAGLAFSVATLSACTPTSAASTSSGFADSFESGSERPIVVASTPIIADMVRNVAGDTVEVTSLVPMGGDPHSFEPTLKTLKQVARSSAAFSNGLLLERQSLMQTIDSTTPVSAPRVQLAEDSVAFGAHHIALVEDASLSTVWLGFRVQNSATPQAGQAGSSDGAPAHVDPSQAVHLRIDTVEGPGTLTAFTTGSFGQPTVWLTSADKNLSLDLPVDAHTHMSWGFSAPGIYRMGVSASDNDGAELGQAVITFAVGVDANQVPGRVIDHGHVDITAHTGGGINLRGEMNQAGTSEINAEDAVIAVPHQTATQVPGDPAWRFLGDAGDDTWVLAQAVVGQHVHGDIDPHLWLDVSNAVAYVDAVTETLSGVFPEHAQEFHANAASYRAELENLDQWARTVIGSIPADQRKLVTTHDGFGYLAQAYGLKVTGFVAPNPTLEPSAQALINLTRTLQDAGVPAVFVEPTTRTHASELEQAASATKRQVCSLYSDTLTPEVPSFVDLVETNVRELKRCLDPESLGAWEPQTPVPHIRASTVTPVSDPGGSLGGAPVSANPTAKENQ